jgi:hypothetical protein
MLHVTWSKLFVRIIFTFTFYSDQIKLPPESKIYEGSLCGATHTSSEWKGCWNFSHLNSLVMDIENDLDFEEKACEVTFEFISQDRWQRETLEG